MLTIAHTFVRVEVGVLAHLKNAAIVKKLFDERPLEVKVINMIVLKLVEEGLLLLINGP